MTTTQLICRECEAEISIESRQAHHAQVSAGVATRYGGVAFAPEQFAICEDCEANLETPYDF